MQDENLVTPRGTFGIRRVGQAGAPLVVCLHGFPDDASTFDALATALAQGGYRVVSPYLRGYAPSPVDGPLTIDGMVDDLFAVVDAMASTEPVCFVGHDYGAQIGYAAMGKAPQRFRAAVMLAGAHPAAISNNMRRLPRQWWMSRYIIFFQLGKWADHAVAQNDFAYIETLWKRWSPGWTVADRHLQHVKQTLGRSMPKPVAMYREGGFDIGDDSIPVPTRFITGERDGCLLPAVSDGQERLFSAAYERQIWPDAGHFLHLEQPARTADATIAWFSQHSVSA